MELSFTVPGRPVGKARPRATIRGGHASVYTPAKTSHYENRIAVYAQTAMKEQGVRICSRPVRVSITASFRPAQSWSKARRLRSIGMPYDHKPDADNLIKSVLDGLNGVVYADDKQVFSVAIAKLYGEEDSVEVVVEEIEA